MSAKSIYEYDGKAILAYWLSRSKSFSAEPYSSRATTAPIRLAHIVFDHPAGYSTYSSHVQQVLDRTEALTPWLKDVRLVAKPDMLIKRRGKSGLLKLDATWPQIREWISERAGKFQQVEHVSGYLTTFLVEPFVPHPPNTEYYINIHSEREGDVLLFTHEGGVDVGDVDAKASKLIIAPDLDDLPSRKFLKEQLLAKVPPYLHEALTDFIFRLYFAFVDCQFTYLEINPLVVLSLPNGEIHVHYLDLAAKIDQTAEFEAGDKWVIARSPAQIGLSTYADSTVGVDHGPPLEFPAPFGRQLTKEEEYIANLDSKTGASLKLTLINPQGRIWTLVAGGGASVVYADAIACAGHADDLANYGEYSGAPTEGQTYEYAKVVLDLMTRGEAKPKILFIGGGIANFTNVASTFKGIIRALREYKDRLLAHNVDIWVRRAGPNYQEGLRAIRSVGEELGLPMHVFGPETHVSGIVPYAIKGEKSPASVQLPSHESVKISE